MNRFGPTPPRLFSLARVDDLKSAMEASENAANAGFVVAALHALGAGTILLGYAKISAPPNIDVNQAAQGLVVIATILAILTMLLSWRIRTGRGIVSAALMIALIGAEFYFVMHTRILPSWVSIIFAVSALIFINGFRGILWLRRNPSEQ